MQTENYVKQIRMHVNFADNLRVCNGFDCLRWNVQIDASTLRTKREMTDLILLGCCFTCFI